MRAVTFDVHSVKKILEDAGYPVVSTYESPDPDIEDDEITLEDDLSVQVGETYLSLTRKEGHKYRCYPARSDTDDLLKDLAKLEKNK